MTEILKINRKIALLINRIQGTVHSVVKWKIYSHWKNISSNHLFSIFVCKPLLSRIFCQKCVRVNFWNCHTLSSYLATKIKWLWNMNAKDKGLIVLFLKIVIVLTLYLMLYHQKWPKETYLTKMYACLCSAFFHQHCGRHWSNPLIKMPTKQRKKGLATLGKNSFFLPWFYDFHQISSFYVRFKQKKHSFGGLELQLLLIPISEVY